MDFLVNFITSWLSQQLIIIPTTVFLLVGALLYHNKKFSYWKRINVGGPKPIPIFGNLLSFFFGNRLEIESGYVQKYGKIYGFYRGSKPVLAVADADVLRQICIKDFDTFPNHHLFDHLNFYQESFIFFSKDNHWKRVRALMSPTFASGKIKKMFKFLDDCAEDLIGGMRNSLIKEGGIINTKEVYSHYTMDAIATCCYGIKLANEKPGADAKHATSKREDFVRNAMDMFAANPLRIFAPLLIPEIVLRKLNFSQLAQSTFDPMGRRVAALIKTRRESAKKFEDYLQLLIEAGADGKLELPGSDDNGESHDAAIDRETVDQHSKLVEDVMAESSKSKLSLTDEEVISNAMLIMVVGLETTATLLTNCTYALAFHHEIQDRLHRELMKIVEFNEDKDRYYFDYDSLSSCLYLDCVISETLRSMPPALISDRVSVSDYNIEKYNLSLPKGSQIQIAIHAIHNSPDYWNEPEKFDPCRFMPGNKENIVPGSYCPFGLGPRHCLGMRFSLTESKLALAKTLMNFRIEPVPGTSYPPEPTTFNIGLSNYKRPVVKLVPRR